MNKRKELHDFLKNLINCDHVYYQPPPNIKMQYPAIVYYRSDIDNQCADNSVYSQHYAYELTVIDSDPDSEIVSKISRIPTARYERHYNAGNLNHDVFKLYF